MTVIQPVVLADEVSREFLLHHRLCPTHVTETGALRIVATGSVIREAIDELADLYHLPVLIDEVSDDDLERWIERLTAQSSHSRDLTYTDVGQDDLASDIRDLANQPPVVRYVNLLVHDAFEAGASDIHLEATRGGLVARLRLDGVLASTQEPPAGLQHAVVSRIKLLAELDIAERRRPQDGRVRVRVESREIDLRVSTVPTMFGESVVLRLLERGGRPVQLSSLGMPTDIFDGMRTLAERAHGIVLVTGPTGSGKTTTLYAALQRRHTDREKIITVEDPIEYQLPGVTQVPVHRQAGVTFSSALRAILRQDPDIVMIGEMRDRETAEIAVQAAMTGHLVFSTLHTNDAVSAVPRLIDLGVQPFLLAGTLEGVLAQRLVRVICDECRESYSPDATSLALLLGSSPERQATRPSAFTHGRGCPACRGTGYRGRVGVFELLQLDDVLRDSVIHYTTRGGFQAAAQEAGMRTMRDDGWVKVCAGITTVEEVLRVA